jgi:hypothetical protein
VRVEALVAGVVGRITEENARTRAGGKLVRGGGSGVRITEAAEDPEVLVGGSGAVEELERGGELTRPAWSTIQEVGDGG